MSNESLRQANNIKAGIFVTLALIVGLIVIFLLGDLWTLLFGPPMNSYKTRYTVLDGVSYLQAGSEVRIGGIKVGKVDAVSFEKTKATPIDEIDVVFSIPTSITLYSNAVATVKSGLISSDSFISISSLGFDELNRPSGEEGTPGAQLKPGDQFQGTGTGGLLSSLMGPKAAQDVDSFLDTLDELSTRFKTDGYVLRWMLGAPTAVEIQRAVHNVDVVLDDVQLNWNSTWSGEVSSILANLNASFGHLDEVIVTNQESFNAIIADVKAVADQANTNWSPQLTAIFADGKTTLANVDVMMADVRSRAPLMLDNAGETLAQMNVASQQLNRAIAEVSANPWRLLYRPTDKEYSNELLYEAARNFSFGAADLKSAAGSMQRLLDARGDQLGPDDEDFHFIRRNLIDSFQRYERAQQQLMEILRGDGSGTGSTASDGSSAGS